MKILLIYPSLTHPVNSGNKSWLISQVQILRNLGHDVFVICVDTTRDSRTINETKEWWGDHVFIFNPILLFHYWEKLCYKLRRKLGGGVYFCDDLYPWGLNRFVKKITNQQRFDACIVNYYWLTKALRKIDVPIKGINTHDVFSFRNQKTHVPNAWMSTLPNEEAKGLSRADVIFALQEKEAIYFSYLCPNSKVLTVYCPFSLNRLPVTNNHKLLMLSGANILNVRGLEWFCKEVFPSIIEEFPDVEIVLGGNICNAIGNNYSHLPINKVGFVGDPKEIYSLGDVAINPCLEGTGLKIKTVEALSFGRIVMSHPHGIEGIYDEQNAPVFHSDNPDEWVTYLKTIWNSTDELTNRVDAVCDYIESMNLYIESQYKKIESL